MRAQVTLKTQVSVNLLTVRVIRIFWLDRSSKQLMQSGIRNDFTSMFRVLKVVLLDVSCDVTSDVSSGNGFAAFHSKMFEECI